jgi:phage-related protein
MAKSELEIIIGLTDKTKGPLGGLTNNLKKVGLVAGGIALGGVVALGAGVAKAASIAIPAASNLAEAVNAVDVVFEDNADTILEWGKTASETAGLSQADFAQMAAQTGAMLQNFGLDASTAADETINLAQRAADMASIFNTDVNDALVAIQAGLRGEADPLERFGVSLSAAAVKAKALELGLEDAEGQLSNTALTTARLALLFEQTDKIAGDFVNTSDQLANASRVNAARWENFMARVGSFMLPIIEEFQGLFMDIAEQVMPMVEDALANIMPHIQRFADLIGQLIRVIMEMGLISSETEEVLTSMFGADIASQIMNVLQFMIDLKNTIADFMTNILIPFVHEHWEALKTALIIVGGILAGAAIVSGILAIVGAIVALFNPITLIIGIIALLAVAWTKNWGGIQEKTSAVIDWIRNAINTFLNWVQSFWKAHGDQIMATVKAIWDAIVSIFEWFVGYYTTIFEAFRAAFEGDWVTFGEKLREAWDMVWELIVTAVERAWEFIKTAVSNGIKAIIKWFQDTDWRQVGIDVVQGIANGIEAGAKWAVNAIVRLAKSMWDAITGFFGNRSPSKLMASLGEDLNKGLALGISDAVQIPVKAAVGVGKDVASMMFNPGSVTIPTGEQYMRNRSGVVYQQRIGDIFNYIQNSAAWEVWVEQQQQAEFDEIDQAL